MKKEIEVSFVLAILNAERTLNECLDSIFMQAYPEKAYEVIIVDGGSKDKTHSIIREFQKNHKNLRLIKNLGRFSEGKGMGKDIGIKSSRGKYVVLLDHDNIITSKDWLKKMLFPFKDNPQIMASQSLLTFKENDSLFIKYVNAIGVEDAFAIPYSLVSQVTLHPRRFELIKNKYYIHKLNPYFVLFGGANGCIFRREVFKLIGGYTRDVDVSASMASEQMIFAVVKEAKIHHKTGSGFLKYLKKKILYFNRFIKAEYKVKKFKWVPEDFKGKVFFAVRIISNLLIIPGAIYGVYMGIKERRTFWLLHPIFLFCMTFVYGFMTLLNLKNYIEYSKSK